MALEFTVDPDLTDKLQAEIVACWTDVSNAGGAVGFVPPVAMDDVLPVAAKAFVGVAAGHDRLIVGRETGAAPSEGSRGGIRGNEAAGGFGNAGVHGGSIGSLAQDGSVGGIAHGGSVAYGGSVGGIAHGGSGGGAVVEGRGAGLGGEGRLAALAFITNSQFRLTEHWRTVKRVMVHPDFQGRGYGVQLMAEVERAARAMGLEMLTLDCRGGTGNDDFYKKCGYVEYGRLPGALRLGAEDYRDQILMTLSLER